ncbi:hypothetical protein [Pseudomonas syringae]|uniref:hypothetical protein n=1 Tax=Pseudomonas syringae TaxID=317 RepID=UPI0002097926|nr:MULTISPECIES: hypothetical protein [Pseudomonas syringae group]KPC10594.1 Uncharacterized protein AC500_4811 [Pseudomonas amygdali pv. lachrymans]MBF9244802.1 hypothetical protein [Pseudomonas syringae pv. tomato]PYD05233.1 hypothetical protein DND90_15895 [Pseudomonas syringae pv. maculicola]EGH97221.1 hypothetical protein PLA106_14054 [Pseudomonas amygdali pv. lachrymans str. M302278]MBW8020216.1 hypothetical protein [Pseudomonas syringae pv. tomato]
MKTKRPSSSDPKASTPSRNLLAIAMVGTALISYQVHKTPDARDRLKDLASLAQNSGDLTARDMQVLTQILATPSPSN